MHPGPSNQSDSYDEEPPIANFCDNIDYCTRHLHFNVQKRMGESYMISPIAIHSFLSLLCNHATSETHQELHKIVCCQVLENMKHQYIRFFNNKIFSSTFKVNIRSKFIISTDYAVNLNILSLCFSEYKINCRQSLFHDIHTVTYEINRWMGLDCLAHKQGVILATDLQVDYSMIFVNGTWFEGRFLYPFSSEATCRANFRSNNEDIPCHMMCIEGLFPYDENQELKATLVQLKFLNPNFSMLLIIPVHGSTIEDTSDTLRNVTFKELVAYLTLKHICLQLPRFSVSYKTELKEILEEGDLNTCFSPKARFPGFMLTGSERKTPHLNKLLHKCWIGINEFGVAAFQQRAGPSGHDQKPPSPKESSKPEPLIVDHPFIFVILYEEDQCFCPLAIGGVVQPGIPLA